MLIVDLIRESFDSEVPYTVVRATTELFTTKTVINGRNIIFNSAGYNTANGRIWEIEFSERSVDRGTTFGKTGSGGAMKVFSFVLQSITELISRVNPEIITFSSHKADGNRSKLYQRMLNQVKIPGYRSVEMQPGDNADYFQIVRNDVTLKELDFLESYQPPSFEVGDDVMLGKFKNRKAEITGFKKDKNNQPVIKTTKGDTQLFKPRVKKLMKEEVIDEYESGTDNSRKIFAKLKELGYEKLGSGQDATVWSKDEASVIKILMPTDKPYNAENGFLTFYNFTQQHKDNPNLPKFVEVGGVHHSVFTLNGTNYRQIAMERLQPIQSGSFEEAMVWILSDFADKRMRWEVLVKELTRNDWFDGLTGPMGKQMPAIISSMLNDPQFNATYSILFTTMQLLYLTGKQAGLGWDLHTENVMQRRDGTLVIVDPFFS